MDTMEYKTGSRVMATSKVCPLCTLSFFHMHPRMNALELNEELKKKKKAIIFGEGYSMGEGGGVGNKKVIKKGIKTIKIEGEDMTGLHNSQST